MLCSLVASLSTSRRYLASARSISERTFTPDYEASVTEGFSFSPSQRRGRVPWMRTYLLVAVFFAWGCSTSSPGSSSSDAGSSDVAPSDAGHDDRPVTTGNECTATELAAATLATNGADISFRGAGVDGGALAYTNNCVRIPQGKDVGWYGDFTLHPMANNGDPSSPIPSLIWSGNDSGRITFPNKGKFSFHCTNHPSAMYGTVQVE